MSLKERMNSKFVISIFLIFSSLVFLKQDLLAQNNKIERVSVEYIAVVNGESTTGVLHHTNNLSNFEWFKSDSNSIQEDFDRRRMSFKIDIRNAEGLFVCKQFSSNYLFSREESILNRYYVTDSIPAIEWTIHPDEKIIGDFKSIKAEGFFRGRNYIVWFTPEIPIPNGPWKLGGLPGLILEAIDEEGKVQFEFHNILTDTSDQRISDDVCNDNITELITWKEFVTKAKKDMKQFVSRLNERAGAGAFVRLNSQFFIEKEEFVDKNSNY